MTKLYSFTIESRVKLKYTFEIQTKKNCYLDVLTDHKILLPRMDTDAEMD